jgi:nitroreductase/dihydropteridine reductase
MAATELRINVTPLEDLNSRALDTEPALKEKGFTATALIALGYRNSPDLFAQAPGSRLPMKRHFTFL